MSLNHIQLFPTDIPVLFKGRQDRKQSGVPPYYCQSQRAERQRQRKRERACGDRVGLEPQPVSQRAQAYDLATIDLSLNVCILRHEDKGHTQHQHKKSEGV
ncbi:hypothetical protein AOLI_G00158540 [Acnodon oligacanthus]